MALALHPMKLLISLGATFILFGCSTPKGASNQAASSPPRDVPIENILRSADSEMRTLQLEIKNSHKEFGTALYAVNRMLFRNPQCLDKWFGQIADIDMGIEGTRSKADALHTRLRRQHRLFTENSADFDEVHQVRNQIQVGRDSIMNVRPKLAFLLADAMNREPKCTSPARISLVASNKARAE